MSAMQSIILYVSQFPAVLPVTRWMVFEAEASGGGGKAGGLPHPSLPPYPPLPLSIPPKFSDKPVGGKVRSSEGEVPRLPPYKYQHARHIFITFVEVIISSCVSQLNALRAMLTGAVYCNRSSLSVCVSVGLLPR